MIDNSTLPSWNLTQYYQSWSDPRIEADLQQAKIVVQQFVDTYRGKVISITAAELHQALQQEENLVRILHMPSYYLHLCYEAGGEELDQISSIQKRVDEETTMISNETTFFDVELSKRPDLASLSQAAELVDYRYYLERLALNAKYMLTEEVEKVLSLKDLTGGEAWSKLFTDMKAKIEVQSDLEGEMKTYRTPDLADLMENPDRNIRRGAWELLSGAYQKNEEIMLETYNNILLDKKIEDGLRGYRDAEESKVISYQLTQTVVDSLIQAIKSKTDLLQRYYRVKQEILGVDQMEVYDLYAEVDFPGLVEQEYTWEDCQRVILEAFREFNPVFGEIAQQFFDGHWIDAQNRKRKYGGAFQSDFIPGFHPVIICTFKGKFGDVLTVAHELGHGIHTMLTHQKQNLVNANYPMSMAEIASLCCESLVFEKLIQTVTDPKLRLKLYCSKVEQEAGNIFLGGLGRYTFESKIHQLYREQGPIAKEQIRSMWQAENFTQLYSDVVNLTSGSEFTWQGVAHFTYFFYNYVYASGLLTSSTIFDVILHDPSKMQAYIEILESGGSDSPKNLLAKLDLDVEDPAFWEIGFRLFEKRIEQVEAEWAVVQGATI